MLGWGLLVVPKFGEEIGRFYQGAALSSRYAAAISAIPFNHDDFKEASKVLTYEAWKLIEFATQEYRLKSMV
jgi:hypothetical protein